MRMCEFFDALVDRVGRTNAENKNSSYERPEKPFLPVTEWVLVGGRSFVEPQTQQQKDLVCGIGNRVERLSHHAGGACDQGSRQLQYRDQSVGKERADTASIRRSFKYRMTILNIHRLHRLHRFCKTDLCESVDGFYVALFAFEFSALEKTDEFARSSHHRDRTDSVSFHQLLRVIESCVWFDKKPRRDRAHDVACACEVPPFARQRLEIFERQHPVQTLVLCDWKSDLPVHRQDGIDQVD